jgi:DNA invertase Pin-like site-specific DNA recombinase
MKPVRCAIYTRKSSEEGLEQDFNSLHAQREACAAYVASQTSEGWQLLPNEYNDGGISGGTLERPGLKLLLADIAEGKVDIVVVYKVDRLTRSLLDFAKLVEAFDKAGTSFVSITQSFNTTTSMGRLTLNMLLSFAQFEREVTAERIRDKLAASKAKGMWMGGMPPLGYKADGRTLAIVEPHAVIVRDIYTRYLELGTVRLLAGRLSAEGITVPKRKAGTGRPFGGTLFSRGQLYAILRNPIYAGEIPHKGMLNPGLHPPLIEREQWDKVQRHLSGQVKGMRQHGRAASVSPLAGKIFDAEGEPLLAAHTTRKGNTRYRYYVSKALHYGSASLGLRMPAEEVEQAARGGVAELLVDPILLAERAGLELAADDLNSLTTKASELGAQVASDPAAFAQLLARVEIADTGMTLVIASAAVATALAMGRHADAPSDVRIALSVRLTRTGRAIRLVHSNGALATGGDGDDPTLLRLVGRAHAWWKVLSEAQLTPTALAEREGVTTTWVIRVVRLAFLSPRVLEGLLAGRLRAGIDADALLKAGTISLDWEVQEKQLLAG